MKLGSSAFLACLLILCNASPDPEHEERSLTPRTNPGLNLFVDFNYGGDEYSINYAPSGACVDLPKSWQSKASSARLTGTSCCLYEGYECNESGTGADYLIQADLAQFPSAINDHLGSVICWNGFTPSTCRGSGGDKLKARSFHSLDSGMQFVGTSRQGQSLTVTAEDVSYSGGGGIPGGTVYSGGNELANAIYAQASNPAYYEYGTVSVGGVEYLWSLDTGQQDEDIQYFLQWEMSQPVLVSLLTDALLGMLDRGEEDVKFQVYVKIPYYNGIGATFTIQLT